VKKLKYGIYFLWALVVLFLVVLYLLKPEVLSVESLRQVLDQFGTQVLVGYILLSFLRGFFLLPSTPFVILGAAIFPHTPLLVLAISMAGVLFSASFLFYFSDWLNFGKYLENKFPRRVAELRIRLRKRNAFFLVLGWSIFPFVPTDLLCYVGGIVKMRFSILLSGVFLGELLLNVFYVYSISALPMFS
jgi:uncharacterized membrane protein YdjX (TVP38/TMEM64 family)